MDTNKITVGTKLPQATLIALLGDRISICTLHLEYLLCKQAKELNVSRVERAGSWIEKLVIERGELICERAHLIVRGE